MIDDAAVVAPTIDLLDLTPPGKARPCVPREIRVNGERLLTSAEHPIVVHEINVQHADIVYVTVTLMARRVRIGHAADWDETYHIAEASA